VYHQLKEGSGNVLGFKIVGGMTKRQKNQICKLVEKQISESEKIRLLIVIEPHKTMDAESLLFDLNFTLIYSDKIERMVLNNIFFYGLVFLQPIPALTDQITVTIFL